MRGRERRAIERGPDDPLYAERGVDADLGRDFLRRAFADHAAVAGIRTLSPFPEDDEVDRRPARERRRHPGIQLGWAQVHVVVEFEAQP